MKAPSLHDTLPAFALAIGSSVDELARREPVRSYDFAHGQQAAFISHSKFMKMLLGANTLYRVVTEHWFGNVLLVLASAANADGKVAILSSGLVTHNLISIKLQDCASDSFAIFIEDSSHTLLDG